MKENLEKVKLLARDLRNDKEFPRSPRETLAGYVLAARALDKCRAALAGWQGEYHSNCPLDQTWLKFAEIDYNTYRAFVAPARPTRKSPSGSASVQKALAPRSSCGTISSAISASATCPELQEYMEDTIASAVPRNRVVYRFFDVYDFEEQRL